MKDHSSVTFVRKHSNSPVTLRSTSTFILVQISSSVRSATWSFAEQMLFVNTSWGTRWVICRVGIVERTSCTSVHSDSTEQCTMVRIGLVHDDIMYAQKFTTKPGFHRIIHIIWTCNTVRTWVSFTSLFLWDSGQAKIYKFDF